MVRIHPPLPNGDASVVVAQGAVNALARVRFPASPHTRVLKYAGVEHGARGDKPVTRRFDSCPRRQYFSLVAQSGRATAL